MYLTYRYRIYPKAAQEIELGRWMEELCFLWNHALDERHVAWAKHALKVSYLDQQRSLTRWRAHDVDGIGRVLRHVAEDCLWRLDLAFRSFFGRVQAGETPGYPRRRCEVHSFTYPDAIGSVKVGTATKDRRAFLSGIGYVPIVLHRDPPGNGVLKTATVSHRSDGWHLALSYQVPDPAPAPSEPPVNPVGVDMGLTNLVTLSDGGMVPAPRFGQRAERGIAREQRRLARKQPGSKNWHKQLARLGRRHARVRNARRDHAHRLTTDLARKHDLVAIERLEIKGLAGSLLSKQVHDAGWGVLRDMLAYKMRLRSRTFLEVDPKGTTQDCSQCGATANPPVLLGQQTYRCACGLVVDRDVNAARNILTRGLEEVGRRPPELTPEERGPTLTSRGRRVFQRQRANSLNQELAAFARVTRWWLMATSSHEGEGS